MKITDTSFSRAVYLITLFSALVVFQHRVNAALITVPTDYPDLDTAVNAAGPGDEIFMKEGVHHANVVVYIKDLTIRGEVNARGELVTMIDGDGSGSILTIAANNCCITELIIQNSGNGTDDAGVIISGHDNAVSHSIIHKCSIGVLLVDAHVNGVKDCIFYNNLISDVIITQKSYDNVVKDSEFQCGPLGVSINDTGDNKVFENVFSTEKGVLINGGMNNDIYMNEFVCDSVTAEDNGENNFWDGNGWSNHLATAGRYPIDGTAGSEDKNPYIALSRDHTPYPGTPTIYVPDDYPTIAEAVEHGDDAFIFVRAGVYYENDIDIPGIKVTVVGEVGEDGELLTVLNFSGDGSGFLFSGNMITVANFIIQNTSDDPPGDAGICVNALSSYNRVLNCLFRNVNYGVRFEAGRENHAMIIHDCRFYRFAKAGILLSDGDNYTIDGNQFHITVKDDTAIRIFDGVAASYITNNVFSNSNGVHILDSRRIFLGGNEFTCDVRDARDPSSLNTWKGNGYMRDTPPLNVYWIYVLLNADPRAHLAHAVTD
ncbi:MAG TPA: NosD domain-containing protein [bacterium]|nr:NosD domain-containing protein [bacterium]